MLKFKLLIFALLAGAFFYLAASTQNILRKEAFDHVYHMAVIANNHQAVLIDETKNTIAGLASQLDNSYFNQAGCSKFLANYQQSLVQNKYLNVGLVDLKGNITCSLLPMDSEIDVNHRPYFNRAIENNDFSIGEYQIGLITKKPSLNFGYPIHDQNKQIVGVVFLAMGLDWFTEFFAPMALEHNVRMKVMDINGTILASVNQETETPGTQGLNSRLLGAVLGGSPNPIVINDENGSPRAYSYQPPSGEAGLPSTFIIVSRPLGEIYDHIKVLFAGAFLASIAAGLMVWRVVLPKKTKIKASNQK
jgi:hypothetical protein